MRPSWHPVCVLDRVASSLPNNALSDKLEDVGIVVALVLATGFALLRVIRGAFGFDPIDADFSLATLFLLVGAWLLTLEARERGRRRRGRRKPRSREASAE